MDGIELNRLCTVTELGEERLAPSVRYLAPRDTGDEFQEEGDPFEAFVQISGVGGVMASSQNWIESPRAAPTGYPRRMTGHRRGGSWGGCHRQ